MKNKHFSLEINEFHGRSTPETGLLAGYGAIIEAFRLPVPLPEVLSLISYKKRQYEQDGWQIFTSRHLPEDSLYKQLVFALKYEGINLLVLKKLFERLQEKEAIHLFQQEPLGQYSRKLWFLYEWLLDHRLDIPDLKSGNYVPLLNDKLQYSLKDGERSSRHRIVDNLPGTHLFCPLIRRTEKLDQYIKADLSGRKDKYVKGVRKDLLQRASAYLLLQDSKASFTIEGERPRNQRAARWGQAIGEAGKHNLSKDEFLRLQKLVIESDRFTTMGFRKKGGFVGDHDRETGEPVPEHISARGQDLDELLDGLLATNSVLLASDMDPVLAATIIAFGFVFIHPYEDGNGRVHRYLIHHVLAKKKFSQQGIIFPVSASILDHIDDYRAALQSYSRPLLEFIDWKETPDHNVAVLNKTADYYRFFDATVQATFLYDCVLDTIERIIPGEVEYLERYTAFKRYLDEAFEIPDRSVSLLVRLLEQHHGRLSKRARKKEFQMFTDEEVREIEENFQMIFSK